MNGNLFGELIKKLEKYELDISDVGFAEPERKILEKMPKTEDELVEVIGFLLDANNELNRVCDGCNTSMYVADKDGITIRINQAFEPMVKSERSEFLGRSVWNLDAEGVFRPSVCALALKERRAVAVLQEIKDVKGMVVTGVPIFDREGNLYRAVTNALLLDYIDSMTNYIRGGLSNNEMFAKQKIIAESGAMKAVIDLADRVKNAESSVLITGETGVGKGILAGYMHETGYRKDKPMIHINCGAIPPELLESELFGYESGAFTGAGSKGKKGLIELSDGGTLFLDEISELPFLLQVKMLHFIQSRRLMRVGGTKEILINTRIISASNKFLEEEVEKGLFRSDLYYRINVIPIHIPPLRERREDIVPVATHFLDFYGDKYNKRMKLSDELLSDIKSRPWLGNVRELENCIERIVVTDQSSFMNETEDQPSDKLSEKLKNIEGDGKLKDTLSCMEKDIVTGLWEKYRSSYKVAEVMGVSQATAYRRIKKYCKS